MSELHELLDLVLSFLKKLNRPIVHLLEPGLNPTEIENGLNALDLDPCQPILDIYSWRNGTTVKTGDKLDDLHLFPGYYFMSLSDALKAYEVLRDNERWNKSWFPVFANGGGDFYAMALEGGDGYKVGNIIGFLLGEAENEAEFESILSMAKSIAVAYEYGIYFEKDGYLDANDVEAASVAARFNPSIDYYNQ